MDKPLAPILRGASLPVLAILFLLLAGPAAAETPGRIVSLAPNVTEILYDLGLEAKVVAVSRYCNYPPAVKAKPKIGGMTNPSLEVIVSLKPDRVILTDDGNPREIERRLRRLGVRTHVFRAKRLDDLAAAVRALGADLQVPDRAERSARRIEATIRRYEKISRSSPAAFPKTVLFVVQPDPLMVAGPRTAIDDVLRLLGLRNIAADAPTEYPRYSLEEVIRQSPDVIFIGKGHEDMESRSRHLLKRLGQLEAVRRGRVYYVGDPLFRMGPRIAQGISEVYDHMEKSRR